MLYVSLCITKNSNTRKSTFVRKKMYYVFSAIFVSQHQKAKYQFPFEIPCVIWKHIGCLLRTTSYYHVIMLYHRDCPKIYSTKATLVQLRTKQTAHLINKNYQNEITLTGQNPPLKCCQPLEILTQFTTGLNLSMLEIWGLQFK